jgi:hypothetical protein
MCHNPPVAARWPSSLSLRDVKPTWSGGTKGPRRPATWEELRRVVGLPGEFGKPPSVSALPGRGSAQKVSPWVSPIAENH